MNYDLRPCNLNDLDFIVDLKRLCMKWYIEKIYGWDDDIQSKLTLKELNHLINDMKIITYQSEDIGITTFSEFNDYYEIGLIIVHPNYQNKGIATKIINNYIDIAKINKKKIVIKTYKENPASKLYEKLGFIKYKTDNTHIYYEIIN